jgi:hypothetical protein
MAAWSIACLSLAFAAGGPEPQSHGWYRVLPADERGTPPFEAVRVTYGPAAPEGAVVWQLEAFAKDAPDTEPLFQLRCSTSRDPLAGGEAPIDFLRYQLRIPGTGPPLEYRDVHTGKALLPAWEDFVRWFIPHPATGTGRQEGLPNSAEYLGHVLTLRYAARGAAWKAWDDAVVLALDPELLIGTGRTFKDAEGRRLPQKPERQNYTYIEWTLDDYRAMIEAGTNLFGLSAGVELFVRTQPVFYRRDVNAPSFPADCYRSNFVGPLMFMDEPTCIMVGDKRVHTVLRYFTDAAALIAKRVRSQYLPEAHRVERELAAAGVSLGDMRLAQLDFPTWETRYETAFYQLEGGGAGFVHEGRYQLGEFNEFARASTGLDRAYTAEEMLKYHYALLRGAARRFGKYWGTSIYGQADPAISPRAVTLAYDMGARYIWFWTSDHDHHLTWNEQLELSRLLAKHAREHPRPSIRGPKPILDKAIAIPYGYFLVLESPTNRRNAMDLWWVRELDAEKKNEASQRYRRIVQRAFAEIIKSFDAKEEFDITVDDGAPITGYRSVVRVSAD